MKLIFKDYSFGVILFKKEKNILKTLIVKQKSNLHFSLPKGHRKKNENEWQAALRELKEETGIENIKLLVSRKLKESYTFNKNNKKYQKTVTYFVGKLLNNKNDQKNNFLKTEIQKVMWVNVKNISQFLFPSSLKVVQRAEKLYLKFFNVKN